MTSLHGVGSLNPAEVRNIRVSGVVVDSESQWSRKKWFFKT